MDFQNSVVAGRFWGLWSKNTLSNILDNINVLMLHSTLVAKDRIKPQEIKTMTLQQKLALGIYSLRRQS